MTVLVSATDAKGAAVTNLTKESVQLTDTGHSTPVQSLQLAESLPVEMIIVLNSSRNTFKQQQNAAIDLAQKVMRPGKDRVIVLNAGGEKTMTKPITWETDPAKVAESVKAMDYKVGVPDAFGYEIQRDNAGLSRSGLEIQGGANNSFFEIAWQLMVQDRSPMRRVLVTFRNPMNHAPGMNQRFQEHVAGRHDQIIHTAQALRAMIFTIVTDEPQQNVSGSVDINQGYVPMSGENQEQVRRYDENVNREISYAISHGRLNVERLARDTGGRAFMGPKKNFSDAVDGIANAVKAQYALTFIPAEGVVEPRTLAVQATGATISAPKSYPHSN
jgi:VWFA-related protein